MALLGSGLCPAVIDNGLMMMKVGRCTQVQDLPLSIVMEENPLFSINSPLKYIIKADGIVKYLNALLFNLHKM